MRWPGHIAAGKKVDQVAAHIDIAPTLVQLCGAQRADRLKFDGVSLADVLLGRKNELERRLLFFQWHRGDVPQRHRACAVRGPRYKLVQAAGRGDQQKDAPLWALYDMQSDPAEQTNVIADHPDIADEMKQAYDAWFDDVSATRGYPAPHIVVGTAHENPLTLTRQDWRGPRASWRNGGVGTWTIDVAAPGTYEVTMRMPAAGSKGVARLRIGDIESTQPIAAGDSSARFRDVKLPKGSARVEATLERGGEIEGAHYVDLDSVHPVDGR
jgi:hypothetical protein